MGENKELETNQQPINNTNRHNQSEATDDSSNPRSADEWLLRIRRRTLQARLLREAAALQVRADLQERDMRKDEHEFVEMYVSCLIQAV